MLSDHVNQRIREARDATRNRETLQYYGDFFRSLADWNWIGTVTLRHVLSNSRAFAEVADWLNTVQNSAKGPIAWVMAQARGELGGRLHVHLLVAGVAHLSIDVWRTDLTRRFGDSQLEEFEDSRGGAHYVAKNGLADSGDFRFGGELLEVNGRQAAAIKDRIASELAIGTEDDADGETPDRRFEPTSHGSENRGHGEATANRIDAAAIVRRGPGRPRRTDIDPVLIASLRRRGFTWRAIADSVGAGSGTVRRSYKDWRNRLRRVYV